MVESGTTTGMGTDCAGVFYRRIGLSLVSGAQSYCPGRADRFGYGAELSVWQSGRHYQPADEYPSVPDGI